MKPEPFVHLVKKLRRGDRVYIESPTLGDTKKVLADLEDSMEKPVRFQLTMQNDDAPVLMECWVDTDKV